MRKFSILFLLILFLANPVFANVYDYPANIKNIAGQIPKMKSIKCKFKQEKYLQNISKPIVSSGDFEFVENKGVYFNTLYPVKSTVNYTNSNYKQINDIINAISAKRYSKLEKEFNFYFEGNYHNWILGMKPRKSSKAYKYISSITLYGSDYIYKIDIKQTNGNKTILCFTK